ncbi:MAG: tRNA (adenosine(37)-N6)-dimethylallyltransferase MiaA [Acidobacteriota bacterium]
MRTDNTTALPVILLAGPTAVGKTDLSLGLAGWLGTEIVNADSMQIYRHMDIGTAKPTPEERRMIPHHLIDVADPDEPFDAARYAELAGAAVDTLHARGKIPVVVGGTGLYMKVLTQGICPAAPTDPAVREQLMAEAERDLPSLHAELLRVDSKLGGRIHPNDRQRIVRALEVFRAGGIPLSEWQDRHRFAHQRYRTVKVFLFRDREAIYERIDRRVHLMLEQGFIGEVRNLLDMGYGPELNAMQSLGYKQVVQHLRGECSLDEAVYRIQKETRHYAKRQITWFRADPEFKWLDPERREEIFGWIERGLGGS